MADEAVRKQLENYLVKMFNDSNGLFSNMFCSLDGKIVIDSQEGNSVGHVHEDSSEPWYNNVMQNNVYLGNAWVNTVTGTPKRM